MDKSNNLKIHFKTFVSYFLSKPHNRTMKCCCCIWNVWYLVALYRTHIKTDRKKKQHKLWWEFHCDCSTDPLQRKKKTYDSSSEISGNLIALAGRSVWTCRSSYSILLCVWGKISEHKMLTVILSERIKEATGVLLLLCCSWTPVWESKQWLR